MPFAKGQSGNPGGRPKALKAVEAAAREHTPKAIETLVTICGDGEQPAAARVAAANSLLDRAWGKARQGVELTGEDGAPIYIVTGVPRAGDLPSPTGARRDTT